MGLLGESPTAVYRGPFTEEAATRLLWRAGFGPRPGDAERYAKLGMEAAVASLTRPRGQAKLIGPEPHGDHRRPLDPDNVWGDDQLWWLDRMVRSNQQLVERMTLVWHSWFATSEQASNARLMINQNWTMRRNALGNFHQLLLDVTVDPAMLLWLNGNTNEKGYPNENYGREMLELFTLGAQRGYDQDDVHQNARALTGWTNDWSDTRGPVNFRFEPELHDNGVKRIFGQRGRFDWRDSCRLAVTHRTHPSFFIQKLWGYFVGAEPSAADARALERAYVAGGFEIRPIVEAILQHPLFYEGPRLVTPPAVWTAGLLRASNQGVTTSSWSWISTLTGQILFQPPNVSGWDYADWLDTARWAGRLWAVDTALGNKALNGKTYPYGIDETDAEAYQHAIDFWGGRPLSAATQKHLLKLGARIAAGQNQPWEQVEFRNVRQNALRCLIPMSPDWMTA
ncbi:MAG TPA: DUF1800 family protein [Solirubrobacteraceae bacterium]|nr:DUF1800 family protein [Solirubrobacteraceae bacterium]